MHAVFIGSNFLTRLYINVYCNCFHSISKFWGYRGGHSRRTRSSVILSFFLFLSLFAFR